MLILLKLSKKSFKLQIIKQVTKLFDSIVVNSFVLSTLQRWNESRLGLEGLGMKPDFYQLREKLGLTRANFGEAPPKFLGSNEPSSKVKIFHNHEHLKKKSFAHQRESLKCYFVSCDGYTIIWGEPKCLTVRLEVGLMRLVRAQISKLGSGLKNQGSFHLLCSRLHFTTTNDRNDPV